MDRRHFLANSVAAAVAASMPARADFESALHRPTQVDHDLLARSGDGAEVELKKAAVQELSDSLQGKLLLRGNDGYDDARQLLNPSFDKYPAMVVRPTGVTDVRSAVSFAAENKLLLAIKSGGHSASGKSSCDGGMQIDLSTFRDCYVDPAAGTARLAGGSLLSELDHESMAHGLVTTAGTVSHTGVGGLTLGGGFGRLARRFGLTIDNSLEFDLVTADGKLRRASTDENPDLFWALRGGGGNFGVVTSFLFKLHPMQRNVVFGRYSWPATEAKRVFRFFAEYAESVPNDMHVSLGMGAFPGMPAAVVEMRIVWSGDPAKVDSLTAPIRKLDNLIDEKIQTIDYVALQRSGDINDPRANGSYMKSGFTGVFSEKLIDDVVTNFEVHPARATWIATQQSGGKIADVANEDTAFAHREAKHNLLSFVGWRAGMDATQHVRYIKSHWANVEPHTRGFYSNDYFDESQSQVNANYRGNFQRLLKIKQHVDPDNLFRLNANIRKS